MRLVLGTILVVIFTLKSNDPKMVGDMDLLTWKEMVIELLNWVPPLCMICLPHFAPGFPFVTHTFKLMLPF